MHFRRFKYLAILIACLCFSGFAHAQDSGDGGDNPDAANLFNSARRFIAKGDYSNAILVLNRAIQLQPDKLEYREQLAYTYYLDQNLEQATKIISPLLRNDQATPMTFQIGGDIYQANRDPKGAEKLYKRGLHKFPSSGGLYNDLGQLYFNMSKYSDALRSWVKGIQSDPGFSLNYYNASRTYYYSDDKVWAIIYGEIFVNLEPFTTHTAEIKGILMESYKKIFASPQMITGDLPPMRNERGNRDQSAVPDFRKAFLNTLAKNAEVITGGVTPESLVMLRVRFLLDWNNLYHLYYPFALFDDQQELLKQGLFEAYNQWIFGPAANYSAFKNWTALHKDQYDRLIKYLEDHPLKLRNGEFYNTGKIEFIPAEDQRAAGSQPN